MPEIILELNPRESITLILFFKTFSDDLMNGSIIEFSEFDGFPVLGSMFIKVNPFGILNGLLF